MPSILGISAYYHDSAAAIAVNGRVIAAAQEERFTRVKHTPDFPLHAIRYCLQEAGLELDDLDAVVFYDKPLLKFERLIETYYAFAPRGLVSFLKAMPVWMDEKLFLKKRLRDGLNEVGGGKAPKLPLLFTEHHLSHAASAFYPSGFDHAAILTIDGVGEWCTASIAIGEGRDITMLRELHFPHSVGLLYSAFTYFLGFTVNSGEYKLMGLAPYGNPEAERTARFRTIIEQQLVDVKEDGSIWLDQQYFSYATGLHMVPDSKWEKLFGFARREPESPLEQHHCDLALAIQQVTEDIVLRMAREAQRLTGCDRLCMAGGVALNCVANGKLLKAGIFKEIYVQPAAGDAGGAVGAALAASFISGDDTTMPHDCMYTPYLGPAYSDIDISRMMRKYGAIAEHFDSEELLTSHTAQLLAEGKVVGWFQGRMEFGPRALGNRSILADPRHPDMQKRLNIAIKQREGFRPFAPAVTEERAAEFFDLKVPSPFMLFTCPVSEAHRLPLPSDFHAQDMWQRLYHPRSSIPAVTHLDHSARVQTVSHAQNPRFHALLHAFGEQTGVPVLINTSFNVRGEPIVCSPDDAYRCFMATDMDALVVNGFVFIKQQQPDHADRQRWNREFSLD
jgi:carbamoyltransferase